MSTLPEGNAIVYCEGAFRTTNGKTAHGLVRRTARYRVLSVVDSTCAGTDAGELLDGTPRGIPVLASIAAAIDHAAAADRPATHLVIGLAPDGGRLPARDWERVRRAIEAGLHVDSGLHDFLSEDPDLAAQAERHGVRIRDVRKPPPRADLHFFSGKIEEVEALRVAVLGTDSAVGKRTTAWMLIDALTACEIRAELVGTGQTAWMQGVRHGVILDSLINDFVTGEIEHAVWSAWQDGAPEVLVLEGQGSLLNPAYPGGFELIAGGRPDVIVLQHAPGRKRYDGFPAYRLHGIVRQIEALELIADRPVVAITINAEGLNPDQAEEACHRLRNQVGLPVFDVVRHGAAGLADVVREQLALAGLR